MSHSFALLAVSNGAVAHSLLQSHLRTLRPMTSVSRTSGRRSATSPVVSSSNSFPTLHVQQGGHGDGVPPALRCGDVHQVLPWDSAGVIPPGPSWDAESIPWLSLCSRDDCAMAVTGTVLSLSLSLNPVLPLRGPQPLPQVRQWPEPPPSSDHCLPGQVKVSPSCPGWGPCAVLEFDPLSFLPSLNTVDVMPQASTCSCTFFLPSYSS